MSDETAVDLSSLELPGKQPTTIEEAADLYSYYLNGRGTAERELAAARGHLESATREVSHRESVLARAEQRLVGTRGALRRFAKGEE